MTDITVPLRAIGPVAVKAEKVLRAMHEAAVERVRGEQRANEESEKLRRQRWEDECKRRESDLRARREGYVEGRYRRRAWQLWLPTFAQAEMEAVKEFPSTYVPRPSFFVQPYLRLIDIVDNDSGYYRVAKLIADLYEGAQPNDASVTLSLGEFNALHRHAKKAS